MAANTNSTLTLSSLDFDTLKDNFKSFLQSQDKFKDYDYNGSNISVLLDILSYNSRANSLSGTPIMPELCFNIISNAL